MGSKEQEYKVTYHETSYIYNPWGPNKEVKVPLDLELEWDDTTGGCCAVGSLQGFFNDMDFKRHKADHHFVTVRALKRGCRDLREQGCSQAFVTINTNQKLSEAAILEAGFTCTTDGWAYRDPKHSSTKTGVKIFTKVLYKTLKRTPKEK